MSENKLSPRLLGFYERRNALAKSTGLEDLLSQAVLQARHALGSQAASVYLYGKDGYLHRRKISGVDTEGVEFGDDWFELERIHPGSSFTGQVISRGGGAYGAPIWSPDLEREDVDLESRAQYELKLGSLKSLIAVPLNGKYRCFGVLEVVNPHFRSGSIPAAFDDEDIFQLAVIGNNLATAFTRFRLTEQQSFLQMVSGKVVEAIDNSGDALRYYQAITDYLTGANTEYTACILRIGTSPSDLETVAHSVALPDARSGGKVSWAGFLEGRDHSTGALTTVYSSHEPVLEPDLERPSRAFFSEKWIKDNNLKSYAGIPLLMGHSVLGALSIFTQYHYEFSKDTILFLKNIASLIASYHDVLRLQKEMYTDSEKVVSDLEGVRLEQEVDSQLHDVYNLLQGMIVTLAPLETRLSADQASILASQIKAFDVVISKIKKRFDEKGTPAGSVQPNVVVLDVLRFFRNLTKGRDLKLVDNLGSVPDIPVSDRDLSTMVRNLVFNAIRAVELRGGKERRVTVSTDIVDDSGAPHVRIMVEDTGTGIRDEDRDMIFNRGFTKSPGGTGMGLYICKRLAREHKGDLRLRNQPYGDGAGFEILLPLERR